MKALKFRVLDEADEMLNMGFVDDVETILGKFLIFCMIVYQKHMYGRMKPFPSLVNIQMN